MTQRLKESRRLKNSEMEAAGECKVRGVACTAAVDGPVGGGRVKDNCVSLALGLDSGRVIPSLAQQTVLDSICQVV